MSWCAHGHEVVVETTCGRRVVDTRRGLRGGGRGMLPTADDVWAFADLVLKVKEPIAQEYHRLRKGQVLFTYLHLAASRECTDALLSSGATAIAYETVQLADRSLPLLAPMSEVAGRMAPQVGARCLEREAGGRGILMGGVSGVYAAKVVVLGAGVAGMNAAAIALGMQAEVLLLDNNIEKLRQADRIYQGHLQTVASNSYEIEKALPRRRPGDRGGLGGRREGAAAGSRRPGGSDEARRRARRHRDRPGRLLRGFAPDHARRADVPGARHVVLLRGQHARRGAAHLDVRADQRHAAVRVGDRRLMAGATPVVPTPRWRWALTSMTARS